MFVQCRDYLIGKLKASGIKTPIITSEKMLRMSGESHIGAVLPEGESLTRSGSKTIYVDDRGVKHKRVKVFDRELSIYVLIGDYDTDKCQTIFETFMQNLDAGINIDGNFVSIEPEISDWVVKEDSILKSKIAVQTKIKFLGGIYRDTDFAKVSKITVDDVVKGKE